MAASARPPKHLHWLILGCAVLLLLALGFIPEVREFLVRGYSALTSHDPEVTRAFVSSLGWAAPLALVAAFVVQAVIPVVPAWVLIAVTVKAYGVFKGFLLVYCGALLGSAAGYGLGRSLGDPVVQALAGESARKKANEFASKHGLQGIMLLRMMPIIPAEAMNLVAGAAGMGFRPFMLATALGVLPVTLVVVWLSGSHHLMEGLLALSVVVALGFGGRWWYQCRQVQKPLTKAA